MLKFRYVGGMMDKKYILHRDVINTWYSILGIEESTNYSDEFYYLDDFEIISSFEIMDLIYDKSMKEIETILKMTYETASFLGNIQYNIQKESTSLEMIMSINIAVMEILNVSTSIDLIPPDSSNEELRYSRLSKILNQVLREISGLDISDIEIFALMVEQGNLLEILSFRERCPLTTMLLILALSSDKEFKDYEIFRDETDNFSLVKLLDIPKLAIVHPEGIVTDEDIESMARPFKRMSYVRVRKMMDERERKV